MPKLSYEEYGDACRRQGYEAGISEARYWEKQCRRAAELIDLLDWENDPDPNISKRIETLLGELAEPDCRSYAH